MSTKQGDVALLNDPVAQKLLQSTVPARLAYTWRDGTPRGVLIWFHWTGEEIVLGTPGAENEGIAAQLERCAHD